MLKPHHLLTVWLLLGGLTGYAYTSNLKITSFKNGPQKDTEPFKQQDPCPEIAPPTTTLPSQSFCEGVYPTVQNIVATPAEDTDLVWYTVETGGIPLPEDETLPVGTYTYYAESSAMGCTSETRLPVEITVTETPPPPVINGENVRYYRLNETAEPLSATALPDHTLLWFYDGNLQTVPPTPSTNTLGETVYPVAQMAPNGCFGTPGGVIVHVVETLIRPDINGIAYVNKHVTGGDNSGDSWENAATELSDALWSAKLEGRIREIWVAAGTYSPLYSAVDGVDRGDDNSFEIENLQLYGGFNGTETRREDRNWKTNPTILSGKRGDPFPSAKMIIKSDYAIDNTILDGFIVEEVGEMGQSTILFGNSEAHHIINHCIIRNNESGLAGALAAYNTPTVTISNTLFHNNRSLLGSGGVLYMMESPDAGNMLIVNCVFSDNEGPAAGGILSTGSTTIRNSILWGNKINGSTTSTGADIPLAFDASPLPAPTVENTITQVFGGADNGRIASPLVGVNPMFTDPTNGDFSFQPGSPAIGAGDNTLYDAELLGKRDLNGADRIRDNNIDLGAFEVQMGNNPLPVTLVSFKGLVEGNQVNLTWRTTDEINTSYFDIERSEDGERFYSVGRVVARETGSHAYQFADGLPTAPLTTYYRLKMVDLDGSYSFSQLIAVNRQADMARSNLSVYPNPSQNGERITLEVPSPTLASFYTSTGQLVRQVKLIAGKNQISLPPMPAGLYLIHDGLGNAVKLIVTR